MFKKVIPVYTKNKKIQNAEFIIFKEAGTFSYQWVFSALNRLRKTKRMKEWLKSLTRDIPKGTEYFNLRFICTYHYNFVVNYRCLQK
jgi:hypothetical protein